MAKKDDNFVQPLYGVSHLDGVTPIAVKFDTTTAIPRAIMIDTTTSIAFDPSIDFKRTDNDLPIAMATSSADNSTIRPWVVHATTGAVLVSI